MSTHLFDQALQLQAAASDQPDTWVGQTSPAYWNMVGPFGGMTAATALQAVLQHPALLGEPVALTVNYVSATRAGAFSISATPVRTNRSTQHWVIALSQTNAAGEPEVAMTATAMTALCRDTWGLSDAPLPQVPAPGDLPREKRASPLAWINRYDLRIVCGAVPDVWDGRVADTANPSMSQLWVRDDVPRPLDFASLTAMADVFYPRIWLRRATRVPAGTVSMTTYFHASLAQLQDTGTGYLLAQARAQVFRHGFSDQTAQLWSEAGVLLATSTQLVYYKE